MTNSTEFCYLDVCLTGEGLNIETALYRKLLLGNTLLLAQLGHPKHTIKGINLEQFLRIRCICSSVPKFDMEAALLYKHFLARGVPPMDVRGGFTISKE